MDFTVLSDGTPRTFAVVLAESDSVLDELLAFANGNDVTAAGFTTIGAFSAATLGFFDPEEQRYIALWDLAARLAGMPLARFLGRVHDRVLLYASGGFTTRRSSTACWTRPGGSVRPSMSDTGHGMRLREDDVERYRSR